MWSAREKLPAPATRTKKLQQRQAIAYQESAIHSAHKYMLVLLAIYSANRQRGRLASADVGAQTMGALMSYADYTLRPIRRSCFGNSGSHVLQAVVDIECGTNKLARAIHPQRTKRRGEYDATSK
jgi:hypothetical protein